jgi:hypothetical protein
MALSLAVGASVNGRKRPWSRLAILVASSTAFAVILLLDAGSASAAKGVIPGVTDTPFDAPAWIAAIAESITALSVILVFVQIRDSRKTAKGERTSAFQERYQSDDFSAAVSRTLGCTDLRDAGQCVDMIEAWSNRRDAAHRVLPRADRGSKAAVQDVAKTLGLFEDMATAYNLNQLDRTTLAHSFAIPTLQIFVTTWWVICWLRHGRLAREREGDFTETVYIEFEDMCKSLRKKDSSLVANPALQPAKDVRALCLPPGHGERLADKAAWSASRRLSLALSRLVEKGKQRDDDADPISKLAAVLESRQEPRRRSPPLTRLTDRLRWWGCEFHDGWEVILVPDDIDQLCDESWEKQRAGSTKLADAIDRCGDYRSLEILIGEIASGAGDG